MKKALLTRLSIAVVGFLTLATAVFASGAAMPIFSQADTATSTPVISSVLAVASTTTTTITWTTDQLSTSQVQYGTTTSYGTWSALDNGLVMSHTLALAGLLPSTTYHFQVLSGNASSTTASSTDQTFTTATISTTTPATSTPLILSTIMAIPTDTSATVTWTTDQPATTQAWFGTTTGYGYSSLLDNGLVTNHSVIFTGLLPSTTYHFQVFSSNASSTLASSTDQMFVTMATVVTPPATTTPDLTALENMVTDLQNRVTILEREVAALLAGNGSGGGTTTPPTTGSASVDQNGGTFSAGGSIDFGGRNFGHEESVRILLNGATVATVHADGGGNFSTGSLSLPNTPGTYTYTFVGQTSGLSATATITLH